MFDSVFTAVTLNLCAAPADNEPAFTHSISVPSDDKTCPLVPKSPSLSYTFPCNFYFIKYSTT